jgi:hypothetical protein
MHMFGAGIHAIATHLKIFETESDESLQGAFTDLSASPGGLMTYRARRTGILRAAAIANQCAVQPPSTGSATPFTKAAPGDASQIIASAISSARPSLPTG